MHPADQHRSKTAAQPISAPTDSPNVAWVKLRSAAYQTFVYQKMVGGASADARPGDVVTVYDRDGCIFGHALYNPRSALTLRMLNFAEAPIDEAFWREAAVRAVGLRTDVLRLPDSTNAYRVVHAEGDGLSGLVVDRYGDVLVVSVYCLGMWRLMDRLAPLLLEATGAKHFVVDADARTQKYEAFTAAPRRSAACPESVVVTEHGVRFRVRFDSIHKTGFFCDQRENRRRLAGMVRGADVLDLCCNTGGFGVYAKAIGEARAVTCVDLDEDAIELAKHNANLNQVRIDAVQADAFTYMRQMQTNARLFGVVVLDPPKLVFGKKDADEGLNKYADLNRLAASIVAPGGVLLTCSCSGAVSREQFTQIVLAAVRRADRQCQVLDTTGAGPDHPVSPLCPESAYLKALWLRIL